MPVVKKLIDLMGESISIESSIGKGTVVTVMIPHRIVEREKLQSLFFPMQVLSVSTL